MTDITLQTELTSEGVKVGDLALITKESSAHDWVVNFSNDCIGFGDQKAFASLQAAEYYVLAFAYELRETGH